MLRNAFAVVGLAVAAKKAYLLWQEFNELKRFKESHEDSEK